MTLAPPVRHTFYAPNVQMSDWTRDQFRPGYNGYCVDVGASDGVSTNSTTALERHWGWTVLCIEANPYFDDKLKAMRSLHRIVALADKPSDSSPFHIHCDNIEAFSSLKPTIHPKKANQVGEKWVTTIVPVRTLDIMLEDLKFPRLDALCIDTEGTERDVLLGLDFEKWRPKAILVETWDQGALDDMLVPLGYERVFRSQDNDGYIHRQWGILG